MDSKRSFGRKLLQRRQGNVLKLSISNHCKYCMSIFRTPVACIDAGNLQFPAFKSCEHYMWSVTVCAN